MRPGIVQKEQQELQRGQQQQEQQESSAAWPHCCSARSVAGGGEECGAVHLVVSLCCTALLQTYCLCLALSLTQKEIFFLTSPPGVFRLLFILTKVKRERQHNILNTKSNYRFIDALIFVYFILHRSCNSHSPS